MLNLKPTHKAVKDYYAALDEYKKLGVTHEMAVRSAFQGLLEKCCRQVGWTLIPEFSHKRKGRRPASIDGALVDSFKIPHAY